MILRAAALLVAIASTPAWAAEGESSGVSLRGRIFTDAYAPVSEATQKELNFVGTSAWFQVDPKLDEDTSARLILETILTEGGGSGAETDTLHAQVTLREAYASYSRGSWDLRFGRQIIPWGKSDGINPTDFLGAKDLTRFNPDEEVKRIGATSLKMAFTPSEGTSPFTITGVWQPVFPRSRYLIAPGSIPSSVKFVDDQPPSRNLENSEYALRATYYTPGWDVSLTGFHGWNHLPEYQFGQINSIGQVELVPTYHQIRAIGADFSKTFSEWIFRIESAYVWTENNDGSNPALEPSYVNSVIGVERGFGENFRVTVQALCKAHTAYTPPEDAAGATTQQKTLNTQIAAFNALLQGYQIQTRTGGTIRLAYTNDKAGWEAELAALAYYQTEDYLIRPKLTRDFTDTFKVSVGGDFYGGPEDKQLGALKYYNSIFFEAKYTF